MSSKALKATGIAVAIILVAIVALPFVVDVDNFRPRLEVSLKAALSREVRVGHMQLSLLAGGARAENLSIGDDPSFSPSPFLQAKSLDVGVSLISLIFSRSLHVTSLTVKEPHLALMRSPTGQWNFASLGGDTATSAPPQSIYDTPQPQPSAMSQISALPAFVLDRLRIVNGTIVLPDPKAAGGVSTLQNIDIDLRDVSLEGAMKFLISTHTDAGRIEFQGEAGPLNRIDPQQTPFRAIVRGYRANLAQIAALDPSSGLAGILGLDAQVTSDGRTVHSEGEAQAEKLCLVRGGQAARQPVRVHYVTDYSVDQRTGVLASGEISAGKSVARLSGTYDMSGTALVTHLKVSGSRISLDQIQGLLPALGIHLPAGSVLRGGTLTADLSVDGPIDRLVATGSAEMSNSQLAGFDLGSKLASLPGLSGLQKNSNLSIMSMTSRFRVGPQGTHISNLSSQLLGIGGLTGDGDIDAGNHLQFHMVAHVSGVLRAGLDHFGLRSVPDDIPFNVTGTTSAPVIVPDLAGLAKNTARSAVTNMAKNAFSGKGLSRNSNAKSFAPNQTARQNNNGIFHKLFGHKDAKNKQNSFAAKSKY